MAHREGTLGGDDDQNGIYLAIFVAQGREGVDNIQEWRTTEARKIPEISSQRSVHRTVGICAIFVHFHVPNNLSSGHFQWVLLLTFSYGTLAIIPLSLGVKGSV
jgi:hypothetical protein